MGRGGLWGLVVVHGALRGILGGYGRLWGSEGGYGGELCGPVVGCGHLQWSVGGMMWISFLWRKSSSPLTSAESRTLADAAPARIMGQRGPPSMIICPPEGILWETFLSATMNDFLALLQSFCLK